MIRIIIFIWLRKNRYTLLIYKNIFIKLMHFSSLFDMAVQNFHLTSANSCTNITQSIIITYFTMLIMWGIVSSLSSQKNSFIFQQFIFCNYCTTPRSCNNFVSIERQYTNIPKSTTFLPFKCTT